MHPRLHSHPGKPESNPNVHVHPGAVPPRHHPIRPNLLLLLPRLLHNSHLSRSTHPLNRFPSLHCSSKRSMSSRSSTCRLAWRSLSSSSVTVRICRNITNIGRSHFSRFRQRGPGCHDGHCGWLQRLRHNSPYSVWINLWRVLIQRRLHFISRDLAATKLNHRTKVKVVGATFELLYPFHSVHYSGDCGLWKDEYVYSQLPHPPLCYVLLQLLQIHLLLAEK